MPCPSACTVMEAKLAAKLKRWRDAKVTAWEGGDSNLRAKCASREELDSWMDRQCTKAVKRHKEKENQNVTESAPPCAVLWFAVNNPPQSTHECVVGIMLAVERYGFDYNHFFFVGVESLHCAGLLQRPMTVLLTKLWSCTAARIRPDGWQFRCSRRCVNMRGIALLFAAMKHLYLRFHGS